tara:strand:+ start:636 stop:785 length:150 start_codon:yes stop_codon:yes gene_type:complete
LVFLQDYLRNCCAVLVTELNFIGLIWIVKDRYDHPDIARANAFIVDRYK